MTSLHLEACISTVPYGSSTVPYTLLMRCIIVRQCTCNSLPSRRHRLKGSGPISSSEDRLLLCASFELACSPCRTHNRIASGSFLNLSLSSCTIWIEQVFGSSTGTRPLSGATQPPISFRITEVALDTFTLSLLPSPSPSLSIPFFLCVYVDAQERVERESENEHENRSWS